MFFPLALFTFVIFFLSLVVWVVTFAAVAWLVWFQEELSLILILLDQDDIELIDPDLLVAVVGVVLLFVWSFGHFCMLFIDM